MTFFVVSAFFISVNLDLSFRDDEDDEEEEEEESEEETPVKVTAH